MLNNPNTSIQPWTPEQLQQIKDKLLKLAPYLIITPIALALIYRAFIQD